MSSPHSDQVVRNTAPIRVAILSMQERGYGQAAKAFETLVDELQSGTPTLIETIVSISLASAVVRYCQAKDDLRDLVGPLRVLRGRGMRPKALN